MVSRKTEPEPAERCEKLHKCKYEIKKQDFLLYCLRQPRFCWYNPRYKSNTTIIKREKRPKEWQRSIYKEIERESLHTHQTEGNPWIVYI